MIENGSFGNSTVTGLIFEKKTDLYSALIEQGIKIPIQNFISKHKFIRYVEQQTGNSILNYWSKKLLPDEALIINDNIYIIEKKYQQTEGSVDEKPQTCAFKYYQYKKLEKDLNKTIHFCYLFNDWFLKDKYKDMLDFIEICGCSYFFNTIPLDYFEGLEKYADK